MAKTIQVTPDIAAIYIKYINKNYINPKSLDIFELPNSNGDIVKMSYGSILELSKQSNHKYQMDELKAAKSIIEMTKDSELNDLYSILEVYEQIKVTSIQAIKHIKDSVESIKQLSNNNRAKIKRFKPLLPRTK